MDSKKVRKARIWIVVLILSNLLTAPTSVVMANDSERIVIFGLDETGSYSFREKAVSIGNSVVSTMEPGEVFYARRITANSYNDDCALFRLEIPRIGDPPANTFDKKARYLWSRKVQSVKTMKTNAMRFMAGLKPVQAKKTDIWGFIAAAADRIAVEKRSGARSVVIITSDMKDNCRREVKVDLMGAEVLIAGFESGNDPQQAQKIRSRWIEALQACNASKVTFLPPDFHLAVNQTGRW